MPHLTVRDDGIYEEFMDYSKLVLPKEILDQAFEKWYGFAPKCKHYTEDGHCLNTAQHWRVGCNGCKDFCDNGNW